MSDSINLDDVYDYLKKFHLSHSLYIIGAINSAMKFGYLHLETKGIDKNIIYWVKSNCKNIRESVSVSLQLTQLARFLLLCRANDYKDNFLDVGSSHMQHALYLISNLHDEDIEIKMKSKDDISQVFGRIAQQQFPLQTDRRTVIGRGYLLFIEIPQTISIQYDFDGKMKEYFNLTVYEFMAAGIVLWLTTNGILYQDVSVEVKALESIVTEENLLKFVELSSGTPGEYRRLVRGDRWKYVNKLLDIYGLDPFIKMPIIKVGYSKTLNNVSYVLPQPFYLLQRTSSGIFYLLATKEKTLGELKGNKAQNNFRNGFGLVYQEYVRMHLRLTKKPAIFIDLDTDFQCKKIDKMPDFAVVYGSVCVLFEVKTHLLAVESRTFFDSDKIRNEVKNGNFKKAIKQLHSFRTRILNQDISDARFDGVNRVINIIIGYEDIFVANSVLIKPLYEEYETWATDLQVGTISDVEVIGAILSEGIDLGQILREKIDDEETRTHSIGVYIENLKIVKKINPILYDAFNSFMDKMGATSLED